MRWISVKDELPKAHTEVLVSDGKWCSVGWYSYYKESPELAGWETMLRGDVGYWSYFTSPLDENEKLEFVYFEK